MTMVMNHDPDDDEDVGDDNHPDVGDNVDHPDDDEDVGDVDQPDEEIPHALNARGSNRRNLEIEIFIFNIAGDIIQININIIHTNINLL